MQALIKKYYEEKAEITAKKLKQVLSENCREMSDDFEWRDVFKEEISKQKKNMKALTTKYERKINNLKSN